MIPEDCTPMFAKLALRRWSSPFNLSKGLSKSIGFGFGPCKQSKWAAFRRAGLSIRRVRSRCDWLADIRRNRYCGAAPEEGVTGVAGGVVETGVSCSCRLVSTVPSPVGAGEDGEAGGGDAAAGAVG
jgi:hypothetical protein